MKNKIVVWSDDDQAFISKEIGKSLTTNIFDATEFDTLEEADKYVSNNYPAFDVTFLQVL